MNSMFGRDKGDRGALAALAIMVAGVVLAVWLGGTSDIEVCTSCDQNLPDNQYQSINNSKSSFYPWRDTYAQWLMAFFSVVATGVSYRAVNLVRESLTETRKATSAAITANETARETGRDQSRAYVHVDKAELFFHSQARPMPSVILTVANTGNTPVKWFEINGFLVLKSNSGETHNALKEGVRWNAIGAHGSLTAPIRNDPSLDSFQMNTDQILFCEGVVLYETFFGERFESEFGFVARPPFRYKEDVKRTKDTFWPIPIINITRKEIPSVMQRKAGSLRTFEKVYDHYR